MRSVWLALLLILAPVAAHGSSVAKENWYEILFSGQKVGFSYQKIETTEGGYTITGRAVMRIKILDSVQDLSFFQTFNLNDKKQVISFSAISKVGNQRQKSEGKIKNGQIILDITGVGGTKRVKIDIPKGTTFLDIVGFQMADRFKVGQTIKVPVFISSLRAVDQLLINVKEKKTVVLDGTEQEVFVVSNSVQGFTTTTWLTREGGSVKEIEGMLGVTYERLTAEKATIMPEKAVSISSLITFSLVKPDKPIDPARYKDRIEIEISGIDNPRQIPRDERQSAGAPIWSNDFAGRRIMKLPVTIVRKKPERIISLEEAGREKPEYLLATPEVQSDNKMIMKFAKDIVGNEQNVYKRAQKINKWVYTNIEKKLVDSFTALDVLLSRRGECQSHTNLFTALARSAGIPTRISAGLVYSKENGGFLYHAWPEIYTGEWIAIDPTLGEEIASPLHLKLAQGGVASSLKLIRFIGKIKISVKK